MLGRKVGALLTGRPAAAIPWLRRQTDWVDISLAGPADVDDLARLLWLHAAPDEPEQQAVESFAVDLAARQSDHRATHFAFVARVGTQVVGMAWVALLPRVPRPGIQLRNSGDIQSVFVIPEKRSQGIGARLVQAATEHALSLGARRVTVHSGRKAVPVYERLGFASSRQLLQSPAEGSR